MTGTCVLLALVAVAAPAAFVPTTERAFETGDFKGTFSNKVRQDGEYPNKVFINGKIGNSINHAPSTMTESFATRTE